MRSLSRALIASLMLIAPLPAGVQSVRPAGAAPAARASLPPDRATTSTGAEILLVLDRSGSMTGTPIADLKSAATTFVSLFAATQDRDKMGLISFATSATVNQPLGTNYVAPMTTAINGMMAVGATNTEDAIIQAIGPQGFTDQTGVPGDQRIQQFLIFFSDGRPTAFRGSFLKSGTTYDAVACVTGQCIDGDGGTTYGNLGRPGTETWFGVNPTPTGDGIVSTNCGNSGNRPTTRWYIFDTQPVPGYAPDAACIPDPPLHDQVCSIARGMTLANAQALLDRGVTIFTIGLGPQVDTQLLQQIASGPAYYYYAPTSAQLQVIFQIIAQQIQPPVPARRETFGSLKARYRR